MTGKHPVTAREGMAVTSRPLASGAGAEMLRAGGRHAGRGWRRAGARFVPEAGRR